MPATTLQQLHAQVLLEAGCTFFDTAEAYGEQLENLGAADVELSEAELAELDRALCSHVVFGHRGFVERTGTQFLKSKSNR